MRHCAFLTMNNIGGHITSDHLLVEPMTAAGWQVEMVPWQAKINWNQYELVIIRTPWDYHDFQQQFLAVLDEIENSCARLENPLDIVRWNIDKLYLRELQQYGCPIVPTVFKYKLTEVDVATAFTSLDCEQLIIKPTVSASAMNTYPISKTDWQARKSEILPIFQTKTAMLQPFINAVVEEGEYSLFYFADEFSHAILKTPKSGDFRVQEEYGGILKLIEPTPELLKAGRLAVNAIDKTLLYARVDLVRLDNGTFALMELELIEPSLYFDMEKGSAKRFVEALEVYLKS